jgi:Stress responsive A/B Barrel Domain
MIRHVVMFRWRTGTTSEQIGAVEEGLGKLPGEIPEIHRYTFGSDLGINVGNFQFAVVADFESRDDYLVYRDNPVHRALIEEKIRPNIEDRTAIQFEID